jgi:serine/threonine protein kinase
MHQRLKCEAGVWRSLSHESKNLVPLLGLCDGLGPSSAMIYPLYDNGNVHYFLEQNPQADHLAIVSPNCHAVELND